MLDILYQDEHIVAINKPSGLLVHRSPIDKHETRFAIQLTRDQIGQRVYPVHRLDKPTSGVLLFALSSEVAALLTQQFTARTVHKRYWAIVRGYTQDSGVVDYPLQEQWDKMTDNLVSQDKSAQSAVTHYQQLAKTELPFAVGRYETVRYSLVELYPKTGRKHQLRRHMKHIFHPIVGDTTHGDGKQNTFLREQFDLQRLMLHARELNLAHPVTGDALSIHAPLAEDFQLLLGQLKLETEQDSDTQANSSDSVKYCY
ncbi:tRNA pseudouridine(65) synthase TruC [Leucothrix pacifica]|uniref:Pseudouridine synthase n=1 Tax=Leucothrix pacifica TaxID=1247513 RepID=A0A317C2I8_9GAMM|nr:tRNA pseudouridine(65) synthase TruC [Leucothrix pacifica]PWQ92845.1 tRNA pseudouridine(65) synthase TruC [Leucothrix pacifica]